ncbi:MAG: hypothetical protein ACRDYU_06980 [Actinomycetes bacterium]
MTTTPPTATVTTRFRAIRRFTRHYLEMVLAMALGMVLLHPLWSVLLDALGWSAVLGGPDSGAMVMATDMTLAMSAWMRYRGHDWAPIAEMAVAMYAPFVVLLVPLWTGAISGEALMVAGHVLMLPAMAVAMLLRRDEYTQAHHRRTWPLRRREVAR